MHPDSGGPVQGLGRFVNRVALGRIFERAQSRTDVASTCGHLLERGGSERWPSSFRTPEPFERRHVLVTSGAGNLEHHERRRVMERRGGVRESGPVHVVATGPLELQSGYWAGDVTQVVTVRGGKLVNITDYWTREEALEAVGLRE